MQLRRFPGLSKRGGYLWKMIEDIKGCQQEVKASKSDKRWRSYGNLKICVVSDPYWQGADAYSSERRCLLRKFSTALGSMTVTMTSPVVGRYAGSLDPDAAGGRVWEYTSVVVGQGVRGVRWIILRDRSEFMTGGVEVLTRTAGQKCRPDFTTPLKTSIGF